MEYSQRVSFGKLGQDVIIGFLEKHFGYRFEAGERNDSVENVEIIEELENCEFIPEKKTGFKKHGNLLRFRDGQNIFDLTMPDIFMSRNSSSGFYWIEAKTHTKVDTRLIIDKKNFDDYALLYTKFTRQDFYVVCLSPSDNDETHDIYWCEFGVLLSNKPEDLVMFGNSVCVWNMKSVMDKLNRYPIYTDKYK
jgi:hypothetical protein